MDSDRWAEISPAAVGHNVRFLLERLPPRTKLIAVVKADGYGHGAAAIARAALDAGAWGLAVAAPAEAQELIDLVAEPSRLLVLGGLTESVLVAAEKLGCAVTASSRRDVDELRTSGLRIPVHLEVDTGMGRFGCLPDEAPELAQSIVRSGGELAGTWTHFANSDADEALTSEQYTRFTRVLGRLGVGPGLRHACNSAAALRHPEYALDAVRIGIALYGCEWAELRPALALRARVAHVHIVPAGWTVGYGAAWRAERPTRVGTVAIGYADGVHRARANRGWTLVRGRQAPLIGRVSMDAITVDLSDVEDAVVGDVVTLIGQDGAERVTAEMVAEWSGTISYEVLTSIGRRVERRIQE